MIGFIADNIQITRKIVENALNTFSPEPIRDIILDYERAGAHAFDLNTGPLTRHPAEKMRFFIEAVQSATSLPIMIDTANPTAMDLD